MCQQSTLVCTEDESTDKEAILPFCIFAAILFLIFGCAQR